MTRKRKVLVIIFLILFVIGGIGLVDGLFAGVFAYWFFIGVIFIALWFLLGPSRASVQAQVLTATPSAQSGGPPPIAAAPIASQRPSGAKVFFKSFGKTVGILVIIGTVLNGLANGARGAGAGFAWGIFAGCFWGTIAGFISLFRRK